MGALLKVGDVVDFEEDCPDVVAGSQWDDQDHRAYVLVRIPLGIRPANPK